jgi:hypothetical protein
VCSRFRVVDSWWSRRFGGFASIWWIRVDSVDSGWSIQWIRVDSVDSGWSIQWIQGRRFSGFASIQWIQCSRFSGFGGDSVDSGRQH